MLNFLIFVHYVGNNMKRTTKHTVSPLAILTGDWHLREDQPVSRTDNFQAAQWRKVAFISELQRRHKCPVIHAGDLFHHWKPSPWLLSKAIKHLPANFYTVYGNHDLPQHNLELAEKSGINVLVEAGAIRLLNNTHWLQEPQPCHLGEEMNERMLIWHVMTWKGNPPYPGCTDADAFRLLRKYPEYDLIHTGHNHGSFTAHVDDRVLVNAGLITRQTADQADQTPHVYLWYGRGVVEKVELPHEKGVISREHIEQKKERDDRIDAFVSRLDNEFDAAISFEENMERFLAQNKVRESVRQIVQNAINQ